MRSVITGHCYLCDCTDGTLGDHCEEHLETGIKIMCEPCPNGKPPEHYMQGDFDGTSWCLGCFREEMFTPRSDLQLM